MVNKAAILENLSFALTYIVKMMVFVAIITGVVLAVDAVALLLLNLWNVDTWLTLLFWEGFVMSLVGVAGWGFGEHRFVVVGWKRPRILHVSYTPRFPGFWLSIGMSGVVLIILSVHLVSQYY